MTYALRRKAPGINTAIATYQPPSQHRPSSSNGSSHRSSRSEASSSRSRSPAQASLASVADENYPASGYLDAAHIEEDYVLAMHDFIPVAPNVQCLSFRAGQVIHVLNRDQTGWWDGELDGRRGWFPSNYVNATATPSPPRPKKSRTPRNKQTTINKHHSASTSISSSHGSVVDDVNSTPSLLISLVQALSLLQNAVRARRITHFQPSTACVISCVRSVLSATDCLGRDSPALATFPNLAAARKQVLSDLARLVNQARKASEMRTLEEDEMDYEIEEMMRMGQTVYGHVRTFLDVAVNCGLELPERRALSPTEDPYDRLLGATPTPGGQDQDSDGYGADDRLSRPAAPLTSRALSSMSMRARSMVDLRKSARRTPTTPTFSHSPEGGPHPPIPQEERHPSVTPSSPAVSLYASGSSVSSFDSDSEAGHLSAWPRGPTSTAQLLVTLRATHDRLLSIIAAFIGHVHSHSQNAHASSKGHLIEMTRETVDQVRQLLALVDSVMATPEIAEAKPRELMALETAKSTLFAYTSSLVDSIRAITSLRATENEDEEKGTCLQAATGALRAGAECVTSVKLCLSRRMGEEPFTIFVLPPPSTYPAQDSRSNSPASSVAYSQYSSYGEELQRYADSADSDGDDQALSFPPEQTVADDTLHAPGYEDPTMHVPQGPVSNVALVDMAVQRSRPSLDTPTTRVPSRGPATPIADAFQRATTRISIRVDHAPLSETESQRTDEDSGSDRRDAPMLDSSPATSLSTLPSETFGAPAGTRNGPTTQLEEKIKRGELPSVPESAFGIPPLAPILSTAKADPSVTSDDWLVGDDYDPRDIALNGEGAMTGATLQVLVVKITDHRAFPDATFSHAFFLTFRLFTSPDEFLTLLMQRFALEPPQGRQLSPADLRAWEETKLRLVRVRTCNAMKSWLEGYWQPQTDGVVLPRMQQFLRESATPALGSQAQRILDLVNIRIEQGATLSANGIGHKLTRARSADRLRPGLRDGLPISAAASANGAVPPTPVMHKTLHASLRNNSFNAVSVLDFDVLELARQLTLMESKLYCAIRPEELLASGQAGVRAADSVRAVTTLSNSITGWVTECILNELDARKRTGLLKYFIKLADRCLNHLSNFSTLRAIMAALDSSTISRLTKTWAGLPARSRATLDALRKVVDHSRNHAEYRSRLRGTNPPGIPFLGIYLTDIIFCRDGNPAFRASPQDPNRTLLNFHRYFQLSRIVQDMQRFQEPYNLLEIAEAQRYLAMAFGDLSKGNGNDLQDLYRRSLLVEPRQPNDQPDKGKDLFAWGRLGGSSS